MTGPLSDVSLTDQPRRGRADSGSGELASWLGSRAPSIVSIWNGQLSPGTDPAKRRLLERLAELIVRMLPLMVGPRTDHIGPVWDRAAALFGAFAEKRGLAAGEAIEELHDLREIVLRERYRDPPGGRAAAEATVSLREVLRLNRALDRAVAHASVGHTDALFFEFFGKDAGTPVLPSEGAMTATREEIARLVSEVGGILEQSSHHGEGGSEH